jgi:hypothetical protein
LPDHVNASILVLCFFWLTSWHPGLPVVSNDGLTSYRPNSWNLPAACQPACLPSSILSQDKIIEGSYRTFLYGTENIYNIGLSINVFRQKLKNLQSLQGTVRGSRAENIYSIGRSINVLTKSLSEQLPKLAIHVYMPSSCKVRGSRACRSLWVVLSLTLQPLLLSESRLRGKSILFISLSSSVGRNKNIASFFLR